MTINNSIETYKILNVPIHSTDLKNTEVILKSILQSQNPPQLITTFNLDFLRITTIDNEFSEISNKSKLNFPDGYGIISIIKKKYNKKVARITGNDIFRILISIVKKLDKKIAIIGGTKDVSKRTEQKLINQYKIPPENLLCISPEYEFEENDFLNAKVIEEVANFKPDVVCASLGCPRQEKWLYKNMHTFGSKVNIGIGATLDFFTGTKKRSPIFLQNLGLEWFWRLMTEPKRLFKRYILLDLPFWIKIYFLQKH
jgi:N-acetylglucosaminyldiphosphoundecaprenol N-acetyl-beta-D-mannosaminyltransferase